MRAATKTDQQRKRSKLIRKTGSISLGMVLIPRENGNLGVERLPVVLDLAFESEWRRGCKFREVPRHQLSIGAFFRTGTIEGRVEPLLRPHNASIPWFITRHSAPNTDVLIADSFFNNHWTKSVFTKIMNPVCDCSVNLSLA